MCKGVTYVSCSLMAGVCSLMLQGCEQLCGNREVLRHFNSRQTLGECRSHVCGISESFSIFQVTFLLDKAKQNPVHLTDALVTS